MKLHLEIWRQAGPTAEGHFESIDVDDAVPQMSILELLDHVNEGLIEAGKEPFAFASDCREGICGTCGLNVNGRPHGPEKNKPSCHQRLVSYSDGDTLKIEPLRSAAYPVIKDMIVDRSALDRVMQQGGYVSVNAGTAPDADTLHMNHQTAELALDHAACIGCGACVAACPNASAMLFTSAKVTHLGLLPQGKPENYKRVVGMLNQMDEEGFGSCSNIGECAAVCPKQIPLDVIANLNRQLGKAALKGV